MEEEGEDEAGERRKREEEGDVVERAAPARLDCSQFHPEMARSEVD